MNHKAKAVFGNHPFTEEVKETPIYIDKGNIGQFIYPDFGLDYSDLNYMYLSTDNLTVCSMEIGPGGFFNPPDYHPGDEVYYVLEGTITQFNSASGQCIEVPAGETLLIPKGTLHSAYNFGEEPVKVLAAIAPKIVESQEFPTDVDGPKRVFKYDKGLFKEGIKAWDEPRLYGTVDNLGAWPVDGNLLREQQVLCHITENKKLKVICGELNPVLMKFSVSNDFLHVGEYVLPAGGVKTRHSDVIKHGSEAMILGLEGPMTVYITETRETYIIQKYEGLFIPANTEYQLVNYSGTTAKAIFVVGKNL